jgi:hypothetical protein
MWRRRCTSPGETSAALPVCLAGRLASFVERGFILWIVGEYKQLRIVDIPSSGPACMARALLAAFMLGQEGMTRRWSIDMRASASISSRYG